MAVLGDVFIKHPLTIDEDVLVANRTMQIELKSNYGLTDYRDIKTETSSGTVTHPGINAGAEYELATTANGADAAQLRSVERGRYQPGTAMEAGIGIRCTSTTLTGSMYQKWGYFDDDNGFYFFRDSSGLHVARESGGTESNVVEQSNWDDPLDGTGDSGLTLDLTDGNIFLIRFGFYGYSPIQFIVKMFDPDEKTQVLVPVYTLKVDGETSVQNPNLPINVYIENGGTTTAHSLFVSGRQTAILGRFNPIFRETSMYRLNQGSVGTGSFTPLISMRQKSGFLTVSAKILGLSIITNNSLLVQIRSDASPSTASWVTPTDHDANETSMEADISSTSFSNGNVLHEVLVGASGTGANAIGALERDRIDYVFNETVPVTVLAQAISTTATVSTVIRIKEEW